MKVNTKAQKGESKAKTLDCRAHCFSASAPPIGVSRVTGKKGPTLEVLKEELGQFVSRLASCRWKGFSGDLRTAAYSFDMEIKKGMVSTVTRKRVSTALRSEDAVISKCLQRKLRSLHLTAYDASGRYGVRLVAPEMKRVRAKDQN